MNHVILAMNYLAHAFLSFNKADILAGNMISDFVKGRTKYDYPKEIQKGIQLHRMIDAFTDKHVATFQAKMFFRPAYRLYAGAFVDVVYDHFLAIDTKQFEHYNGIKNFTQETYSLLDENFDVFPLRFQKMFPYMKSQDWLFNYQFREGIQKSFQGLSYRAKYIDESETAFKIFNENYKALKDCYAEFFPELLAFTLQSMNKLSAD